MNKVICFAVIFVPAISAGERPVVSLEDGLVKGTYKKSYGGRKFSAFEGIPYAQPPNGDLRFEDPQPAAGWKGALEANVTHTCLQLVPGTANVVGEEDCLYLNVYVPLEEISSNNFDVIVHFHGGAFMMGSPQLLAGPEKLMDRDVVYISVNYRLGPLGFLSSGDAVIPGNYGMKDQTSALKWVQKNIERFGGNSKSVTITGTCAGGGSTDLHYLSPLSKGLFHRGVAGNGVSSNPWAIRKDPWANGKILAKELGCYDDASKEAILRCLREKPALQLQVSVKNVYKRAELMLPLMPFGPTVEPDLPTSFLTKDPHLQLREKVISDVPFMAIMTTDEGTVPAAFYLENLQELNENLDSYLPYILEYGTMETSEQDEITRKIKEHYLNDEPITKKNVGKFVKVCTDRLFHEGAYESIRQHVAVSNSNVYFLLMEYAGEKCQSDSPHLGVGHSADVKYYYNTILAPDELFTGDEKILQKKLLDMFVNFAKTGKPTIKDVDFEPVPNDANLRFLMVKNPKDIEMTSTDNFGDVKFWHFLGLE